MENLDLKQMSALVDIIAEEKGLPRETVLNVVEQSIAAAWRKEEGERDMSVHATLNTQTGEADVYVVRQIVEDGVGYNPATEIPLADAIAAVKAGTQKFVAHARTKEEEKETEAAAEEKPGENEAESDTEAENETNEDKSAEEAEATDADATLHVGDTVEEKIRVTTFGRVAAMTAKQVVIQRLREAENDAVLAAFEDKVGTVVTGTVSRIEPKLVRLDFEHASGILPRSEQIDGEYYNVGHRLKVYIKNVERSDRGTQLILSRGNTQFIEYLFRQEVPELTNGTVEIRGIAREAGRRTKIAVVSNVPGIDPVGTFVGGRGMRVQAVMNEIGDHEKIDIINWSDNASEYIREALSPAEIIRVEIEGRRAKVFVTEDQQKIAIGTKGQNVRLASKLTGYELDIELVKPVNKKKKQDIEDSLLSAVEESESTEDAESAETSEQEHEDVKSEPAAEDVKSTESTQPAKDTADDANVTDATDAVVTAEASEQEHEDAE